MTKLRSFSAAAAACVGLTGGPFAHAQAYVSAGLGPSRSHTECDLGVGITGTIHPDFCRRLALQGVLRGGFVWPSGWGIEGMLTNAGATQRKLGSTVTVTVGVPVPVVMVVNRYGPGAHYQIDDTNLSVALAATRSFKLSTAWQVMPKLGWAMSRGRHAVCINAPSYDGSQGPIPCSSIRSYSTNGVYFGVAANHPLGDALQLSLGLDSTPVKSADFYDFTASGIAGLHQGRAVAGSMGLVLDF